MNLTKDDRYFLEFKDFIYDVYNNDISADSKDYKRLLKGMSGKFESGRITAIMGSSGSCKSSFLNALVGYVQKKSKTYGTVLFCGKERDSKLWSSQYAYMEQEETRIDNMTVEEFMIFYLRCKLKNKSVIEIKKEIFTILGELGMRNKNNVLLSALSGGEWKRVKIGIEFILKADILILDEPTTDLDSTSAFKLMNMIKRYAINNNKIVIITIHQPGDGLFKMIDDLYFLSNGLIIYNGPVIKLREWFSKHGIVCSDELSEPEFLSLIFSDDNVLSNPEFSKMMAVAKKLIKNKEFEAEKTYGNFPTSDKFLQDSTFKYMPDFLHIRLLISRNILLTFRKLSSISSILFNHLLYIFLFFIVSILYLTKFIQRPDEIFTREVFPVMSLESSSFYDIMSFYNHIKNTLQNISPSSIIPFFYNSYLYVALSFLALTGLFTNLNDYVSILETTNREIHKHCYSITSLYFATLFGEVIFDFSKLFIITIFGLISGFFKVFGIFNSLKLLSISLLFIIFLRLYTVFCSFAIQKNRFFYFISYVFYIINIMDYIYALETSIYLSSLINIKFVSKILKIFFYILHGITPSCNFAFLIFLSCYNKITPIWINILDKYYKDSNYDKIIMGFPAYIATKLPFHRFTLIIPFLKFSNITTDLHENSVNTNIIRFLKSDDNKKDEIRDILKNILVSTKSHFKACNEGLFNIILFGKQFNIFFNYILFISSILFTIGITLFIGKLRFIPLQKIKLF